MREAAELTASRPNLARAWWPALVWIGLIAFESTDFCSSQNTGSVLYAILQYLFGHIDYQKFFIFHHYLRKTGHFVGYGMLSVLMLRGWRATLARNRVWIWRPSLLALLGTAFVATMDEWHQTYIPSRTGSIWDVALDSTAGAAFLLAAYFWLRRDDGAE
jgi:VanZ family protein